jgi:hypothetical protein
MRAVGSFNFKLKFWNFKKNQTEIDRSLPKYEFLLLAKRFFCADAFEVCKKYEYKKFSSKNRI